MIGPGPIWLPQIKICVEQEVEKNLNYVLEEESPQGFLSAQNLTKLKIPKKREREREGNNSLKNTGLDFYSKAPKIFLRDHLWCQVARWDPSGKLKFLIFYRGSLYMNK